MESNRALGERAFQTNYAVEGARMPGWLMDARVLNPLVAKPRRCWRISTIAMSEATRARSSAVLANPFRLENHVRRSYLARGSELCEDGCASSPECFTTHI